MTRLPAIDLVRGSAALAVLAFHYSTAAAALGGSWPVLPLGDIGVRVFFVISGYVIMLTAMRSPDRRSFAWARFVRLWPGFVACMALTTLWVLALRLTAYEVSPSDWLLNLTMAPAWFGAEPVDSVYWSLAYEIAFYAVVCAALPWVKGEKLLRTGSAAHYRSRPFQQVFPTAAARLYTVSRRPTPALWLCAASLPVLWWQPMVAYFLIGVVAHEISQRHSARRIRNGPDGVHCRSNQRRRPNSNVRGRWLDAIGKQFPAIFCTWAGAISYPLYLLHAKIGVSAILILSPLGLPAALGVTTAAMLLLATAVNRLVERPTQAMLRGVNWRAPAMVRGMA